MSRAVVLACALALIAGCREEVPLDMGLDMAPVDCTRRRDCLTCCNVENASGAFYFDATAQPCVCGGSRCAAPCAGSVCGSTTGVDATCRACLFSDGGVCAPALTDCLDSAGACGAWKACIDRCP